MIAARPRKVMGIKLPGHNGNLSDVARAIKGAGEQVGKLASEVSAATKKAEQIGKVLS
jgi:hypothetical protein